MNKKEILNKYYNGESTLDEEKWLRENQLLEDDFSTEKDLFQDILNHKESLKPKKRSIVRQLKPYLIPAIAASLLLLVWVVLPNNKTEISNQKESEILVDASFSGEITDEEMALAQTKKALAYLNTKIKEGTQDVHHIKKINQSINKIK